MQMVLLVVPGNYVDYVGVYTYAKLPHKTLHEARAHATANKLTLVSDLSWDRGCVQQVMRSNG